MRLKPDNEYAAKLGRHIRLARRKAKLSARALGESAGVHRNTVVRWESGEGVPRVDQLRKLQAALLEKGCRL